MNTKTRTVDRSVVGSSLEWELGFARLPEVMRLTGAARSTLYAWIADHQFPRPHQIGPRMVGWRRSEVAEWLAGRGKT